MAWTRIHQGEYRTEVAMYRGTVLFWMPAAWCPVCRALRPGLEALMKDHPTARFVEADWDNSPELKTQLDSEQPPVILIYKNGKQIHASEGMVGTSVLDAKLKDSTS